LCNHGALLERVVFLRALHRARCARGAERRVLKRLNANLSQPDCGCTRNRAAADEPRSSERRRKRLGRLELRSSVSGGGDVRESPCLSFHQHRTRTEADDRDGPATQQRADLPTVNSLLLQSEGFNFIPIEPRGKSQHGFPTLKVLVGDPRNCGSDLAKALLCFFWTLLNRLLTALG
jgi:hypothetical protein